MSFPLSSKPRIVHDVVRFDYEMRFVIRHSRSWVMMKRDEQQIVLHDAAEWLERHAAQMREEAELLADGQRV